MADPKQDLLQVVQTLATLKDIKEYYTLDTGKRAGQTIALVCQLAYKEILDEVWKRIDSGKAYYQVLAEMAEDVVEVGFQLADNEGKLENVKDPKWLKIAKTVKVKELTGEKK